MEETRATKLFSDFVSAHDEGLDPNLDALCRKHPKCADELRELHSLWQQARSELGANDDTTRAMKQPAESGGLRLAPPESEEAEPVHASLLARLTKRGPTKRRFVVKECIGRGGMGAVYRVYDNELGRHVAAKVIRSSDPAYLPRFLEEAQITGQLDHPAFIPVHDIGVDEDGKVFFTMKLVKGVAEEGKPEVRGETLIDVIERIHAHRDGWTLTRGISDVILRTAEAMAFAHAKGVIHRDLKPENILVGRYGEVYVTDFGVARVQGKERAAWPRSVSQVDDEALDEGTPLTRVRTERRDSIERNSTTPLPDDRPDSPGPTEEGATIGTAEYMPPEQARARLAEIGPASDIYSLGATLYHLIAGVPPWHTHSQHPARHDVLRRIADGVKPPALHTLASNVPAELVAIVDRAMAKEPLHRYASMQDFAADLRAYLERRVVSAYEAGAFAELKKWIQRNPALSAAAGLLLLVLVGSTLIVTKQNREVETQKRLAEAKIREFDQLSGKVYLERAITREKELYPPWPEAIDAMERWLARDAKLLMDLKPALESTLRDLRTRALPQSDEERERDRMTHPKLAELGSLRPRLAWIRSRMEALADTSPSTLPTLSADFESRTALELNDFAWARVDPDFSKRIFGEEALALAVARRAISKIESGDRTSALGVTLDTLAWACFVNGLDAEARAASARALELASVTQKAEYATYSENLNRAIEAYSGETGAKLLADIEAQVLELEAEVNARRTFTFLLESETFLYTTLQDLVKAIKAFELGPMRDVKQRLEWAKRIDDLTLRHPNARVTWEAARAAILKADDIVASKLYARSPGGPLNLRPHTGLVPIGMNPVTKLWEFYDLRSACDVAAGQDPGKLEIPVHREDGSIEVKEGTGIVFVLMPGGTFLQGAQKGDPNAPNYDPLARPDEGPPQQVTLSPFFLARHELTRAQWYRLSNRQEPSMNKLGSAYPGDPIVGWTHPVEGVNWWMSNTLLRQYRLTLPTESRWEYAVRGGTSTPWWTGITAASLFGAANVLDRRAAAMYPAFGTQQGDFDDGSIGSCAVGSLRANPFGLFDMHGNVAEWMLDAYVETYGPPRPGDGLRTSKPPEAADRVSRGGGFGNSATLARSANRNFDSPSFLTGYLGVRPARDLEP